jgi:hypothetical protein
VIEDGVQHVRPEAAVRVEEVALHQEADQVAANNRQQQD